MIISVTLFAFILLVSASIYCYLIFYMYRGWQRIPEASLSRYENQGVSIIIAARNEANNINQCIQSILHNEISNTPFEIIVVDDHSTDNTVDIVHSFSDENVHLLRQNQGLHGKKAAIDLAIAHAKYDIVLCTDADCLLPKSWIKTHLFAHIDASSRCATGLVLPRLTPSLLARFQWLDFAATMAITANGIQRGKYFLANGANLSYRSSDFTAICGFTDNHHLSSGDDVFLINKMALLNPESILFLKSKACIVETKAESQWSALVSQRKRWATKSLHSKDKHVVFIQMFVFFFSLTIVLSTIFAMAVIDGLWMYVILAIVIKMVTDFLFLNHLAHYFGKREVMTSFIPCFFIYFLHILISGYFAIFPSSYTWKSRKTN